MADVMAESASLLAQDHPDRIQRRQENQERSARRARSRVRRYVVSNGLTRMLTLTFAPIDEFGSRSDMEPITQSSHPAGISSADLVMLDNPPSRIQPTGEVPHAEGVEGRCVRCGRPYGAAGVVLAMRLAAAFVRRLRRSCDVEAMPYVVVPEYHADQHVHLHVLVARNVEQSKLEELWPWGFVDAGKSRTPSGGARAAARVSARYATKYVTKAFEEGMPGRHRYEVGEGFQPEVVKRCGYRSLAEAVAFVTDHAWKVTYAVHSDGLDDYEGPPFLWVACDPPG